MRASSALLAAALWTLPAAAEAPEPPARVVPEAPARVVPEAPARVVSVNLCTDQLAAIVAPDLLVSVSRLADDPRAVAMPEALARYPRNSGAAEEVFLLAPDLVLAGTWSPAASAGMLERLGVPVERFAPETSLADVAANLRRMGEVLGRPEAGEAVAARFEADLAALAKAPGPDAPLAALWHANGYTLGAGTLSHEMLSAAGLRNLAAELGLSAGARLPLESLVMGAPDAVVSGAAYPGASRAEAITRHPALGRVAPARVETGADWVCGLPAVLRAIAALRGGVEGP